jgi:peptidoglycan L-alanyl-D-glutamate endopeptidase CwlK
MIDNITLERIKLLHPKIRTEVHDIYVNEVVPALTGKATCRFAYTLRTFAEQNALYAQGRTKLFDANGNRLGIVTNAAGGKSIHNYGLAFDIVLLNEGSASWDTVKDFDGDGIPDWMEVVNIFINKGYVWGGNWKSIIDKPHLEKTFGLNWAQCSTIYQRKGGLDANGYIIF